MIDKVPLAEVATAACTTGVVAVFAFFSRPVTQHLLLIWALASSVVLVQLGHATVGLLVGVAVIAAARLVMSERPRRALLLAGLVVVVLMLTWDVQAELQFAALATTAVASLLFWYVYCHFGQALTIMLIAGSAVGIYVNVPDTEQIAVLAAGLVVLAAAALVLGQSSGRPVWFGSLAVVAALVICAAAVGARGRPPSFIGVVGALGVLLAEPAAAFLRRNTRAHPIVLVTVHAAAVLIASRIAGVREAGQASAIVAGVLGGAVLLLAVLPRRPMVALHT